MEQEQIIRFITGNMDANEAKVVRAWMNADKANKDEFIRLKNIHAFVSEGKLKLSTADDFLQITNLIKQKSKPSKSITYRSYLKYAALLITALLIGFGASEISNHFPFEQAIELTNEFYAPEGQISEFKLSDGTRVWLNSGTRVKIPVNYDATHRAIFLEGEAFFEVTKDPENPFFVHTNQVSVKVMGTSFNVSDYASDQHIRITLIEGQVGIKESHGNRLAMLLPGQQLEYDKTTRTKVKREMDTTPYAAWRDGKLMFKDRTLEFIAHRLERWYNVEIKFSDQQIGKIRFTGTILKNKPLNQVLEVIALSASIHFNIEVKTDQKNQVVLYSPKK